MIKILMRKKKVGLGVDDIWVDKWPRLIKERDGGWFDFPPDCAMKIALALKAVIQSGDTKERECGNDWMTIAVRRNPPARGFADNSFFIGSKNLRQRLFEKGRGQILFEDEVLATIRALLNFTKTPYFQKKKYAVLSEARMEKVQKAERESAADTAKMTRALGYGIKKGQMAR